MTLFVDTHVHIYPVHHAGNLIRSAAGRLRALAASNDQADCALCLTEGQGYAYFDTLLNGRHGLPSDMRVEPCAEAGVVRVVWDDESVWIFAGRQVVAKERVEILALTLVDAMPDGQPAASIIERVNAAQAVPVLAWAPGKWLFGRAGVVAGLADRFPGDRLWLGDSSLRARGWPEPALMRQTGRLVVAGSDPLPFGGDARAAGRYASRLEGPFDPAQPVTSLRALLRGGSSQRVGRRDWPWEMAQRMRGHRRAKAISS